MKNFAELFLSKTQSCNSTLKICFQVHFLLKHEDTGRKEYQYERASSVNFQNWSKHMVTWPFYYLQAFQVKICQEGFHVTAANSSHRIRKLSWNARPIYYLHGIKSTHVHQIKGFSSENDISCLWTSLSFGFILYTQYSAIFCSLHFSFQIQSLFLDCFPPIGITQLLLCVSEAVVHFLGIQHPFHFTLQLRDLYHSSWVNEERIQKIGLLSM